MRVLVACEESQEVCRAFRAKGHEAYSCDIQEPSGGHPEWHIHGDALKALKGGTIITMDGLSHDIGKWDMLIAHPPCTYLAASSAVRLFNPDHTIKDQGREHRGWVAKKFFMLCFSADIPKVAIENPVPLRYFQLPRYTQIIEPFLFGDPWRKRTCLWLRGLPRLIATNIVDPEGLWVGSSSGRNSKYALRSKRNQKERAKTFPGIAKAMVEQWGTEKIPQQD